MLSQKNKRARRALDAHIEAYRPAAGRPIPSRGWLRAIRDAIGMSGQQYADRLGVAWQSMADLEASEAGGTITLNSLRKAAAALNCRLVYAIVPDATSLEDMVNERAREIALSDLSRVVQTMRLEDQESAPDTLEARLNDQIAEHVRDGDLWSA
ncbi:MAG: mobile mystery protein A [Devosia nanyangense]|uniref:Mobile mystery protein A n=1 Tax=Devosia nanyangense TaxID=1228055 RepID=A0A933L432_9HYPH|nr:mobile mystery protein A [Devosia nanyangense]